MTPEPSVKRWAWIVAGLYVLTLAVLTVPVCWAAFGPDVQWSGLLKLFISWQYWAWLVLMFVGQLALLAVPVRIASRRPATKGALWPTVVTGGLMTGALFVGAAFSVLEFIYGQHLSSWWPDGALLGGVGIWIIWGVVFFRLSRRTEPRDLVSRQCGLLLKGSILELLIAVPTHIVARSRNYCCAGFMTFIGLTAGISVMLFSFGPAIFFLYVDRWKRLHPEGAESKVQGPTTKVG
jgi:hypothetical protein